MEGTDLAGETGAATIDLTEQEDGKTWKLASAQYLLPPSESSTTITVNIVKSGGTSSCTYNTGEQLGEGYKLNIEGTYTEAVGVTLAGTITGSVWKDEKTIAFEFDESGSSASEGEDEGSNEGNNDNGVVTGTIPSVGDSYNGCYVLSVSETDDVAGVLLLSPKSKVMWLNCKSVYGIFRNRLIWNLTWKRCCGESLFSYEITFLNLKRVCQNRLILTSIKYPKAFNYSSHHWTITLSRFPSEYPSIITLTIAAPLPMGVPVACSMIPEHSRPAPRLPLSQ